MRHERMILAASVALLAGCSDSTGPDNSSASRTGSFAWSGQVALAGTIEIRNINGDVRARRSRDGTVRVRALKEGRDDDPAAVRIEVLETSQGVTICALYPDVPGLPPNRCLPGLAGQLSSRANDVTVDFDIEVPDGRAFVGRTLAGAVEAAGLSAYVSAQTMAGDIDISTSGIAEATTISGNISVSIGGVVWDRDLTFNALAGHVTVRVPARTNADVWGSARGGSISTDFPLSITRFAGWQQLQGRLGSGGRNLNITAGAGNIALLVN